VYPEWSKVVEEIMSHAASTMRDEVSLWRKRGVEGARGRWQAKNQRTDARKAELTSELGSKNESHARMKSAASAFVDKEKLDIAATVQQTSRKEHEQGKQQ